jgi:sugar/nucleoside kinase (ribokinase family)
MNITVVGHVCIDNNISENVTYTSAGSPAMFMVKVYKKFPDVLVNIIAPYGRDFLTYLGNVHIYPKKPTAERTLIYENKSRDNIRTQKALNRKYAKPLPIDTEFKKIIASSDVIFFAPLTPDFSLDYVENFITPAKKDQVKILMSQGYCRDFDKDDNVIQRDFIEAAKIIPLFDFVIVSDQDHKDINNIAKSWAERTNVIITLGDKGAKHLYRNDSIFASVDPVKSEDIVDSVGSGDIFSAAFGYKYFLIKNVKKSLEFANNIARQCLFYPSNNLQFTLPQLND